MRKRVLVWMSWWVDSSVAAHLLIEQWYEVIAGFMKNYADEANPNCHTREDRNTALKVSQQLGIKTFIIFDFREEYHQRIIQYIYDWYQQWLTPNPDVLCNSEVKFKLFLDKAMELGCDYVATWHYARISKDDQGYKLLKWLDQNKDQSYFLSGLNQEQLSRSLFPIWSLEKDRVRDIAHERWLINADRKDSQGLCFIWKVPIREFLKEALPEKTGDILDISWSKLWEHAGAHFTTIWQRTWLWLSWWPRYVVEKNTETNTVIVSKDQAKDLMADKLLVNSLHWINTPQELPRSWSAKIRYRQTDQACTVSTYDSWNTLIHFEQPQRAISAGQIVVLYQGDQLIASWVIKQSLA